MGEMTGEELAAMTDPEPLAYEREHHGDPYMTLAKAKEMQRVALQFWHVGAAKKKADREAQEEARRRLHEKLSPYDSAVLESDD
jgi:UDP-N-acetylglucosamine 2-epimerase